MKMKDSILSKLFNSLLISSYFSTFYKDDLLQLLNHSFQPFSFHSISFIQFTQFAFFLQSQFSLNFSFQKVDFLFQPLYIPNNSAFPPWFIFVPMLCFLQSYPFCHSDIDTLIKLFVSVMLLLFKYLITLLSLT